MIKTDIYENMLTMISNKTPFSFIRYGDGEFGIMFEDTTIHSNAVVVWGDSIPIVGKKLLETFNNDNTFKLNYYVGIQNHGYQMFKDRLIPLLTNKNTCDSDILHRRSSNNNIHDFFEVLSNGKNLLIGPWYMSKLNMFNFDLVETEQYGSWIHIDDLKDKIHSKILSNKYQTILYSCSLAAKLLIDYFYTLYGDSIIQIDTGSLFDPYCGMYSRKYHINVIKKLGLDENKMMKPKIK